MKKMVVFCLGIVCGLQAFSQKNYKKTVVYTNSGDSIVCYLKDNEWLTNPSAFNIKRTPEGKSELLDSRSIARIVIEGGDQYVAATVKVDITPSEFQTAFVDPDLIKSEEVFVFLLAEYIGKPFSLYSLRKNDRVHLYLQKEPGGYEELIYRNITLVKDGTTYQTDDRSYIEQLTEAFAGCDKAVDKSKKGNYSSDNLINILRIYDEQCNHNVLLYSSEKKRKANINIVLLTGVLMNKTSFSKNADDPFSYELVTKNPLKANPGFTAGVRINLVTPRLHQKLSFLLDICYRSYKATATQYTNYVSANFYDQETLNIQPSLIGITPMARYYFFQKPLRLFIQGGFVLSYALSHKDQVVTTEYLNGQTTVSKTDPYSQTGYNKEQYGFTAGAGIEYNRFSIDYKFEKTTGFVSTVAIGSSIQMQNILLGFRINK